MDRSEIIIISVLFTVFIFGYCTKEASGFVLDDTGLIGQYAHGNEPSHHVAYLYTLAEKPWRTQERMNEIVKAKYINDVNGLYGNNDCGQMSA